MVNPVVGGEVEDETKNTKVANLWVGSMEAGETDQLRVDPELVEEVELRVHLVMIFSLD